MSQAFPRQHFIAAKEWPGAVKKISSKKKQGFESGHKRPDPEPRYLMFNEFWQYENKDKQILSV